jgi:hypothetical protein
MEKTEITANAETTIKFTITFKLNPTEASALEAIAGYGHEPFLKKFYTKIGKAYLQPHEKGVISLFRKIKDQLPAEIHKVETAKKAINEALKNI